MEHIGIFNIYNKKVYIDFEDDKVVGYYYYKEQKEYLNINQILGLTQELFEKNNLQYLGKEKAYKVFKDKNTGFLRFFKNEKEDFFKFFLENGKSAILYSQNDKLTTDKYYPKMFKNKKTRNIFILTLCSIAVISISNKAIDPISTYFRVEREIKKYSSEKIFEEYITSSDKLSLADKKLLKNDALFEKISQVKIDYDRVKSLEEKLNNIYIKEFSAAEKEEYESGKSTTVGYYRPLYPNRIKILDPIKDEDTKVHEFLHLLEEHYEYVYIVEALTEIIKKEFYYDKISNYDSSYIEEQTRTKVLMEIIDPEILWEMLFTGDEEEFENTIMSLLSVEETAMFLDAISETLTDKSEEDKIKTNETIDYLLAVMYQNKYNDSIKNNEIISLIYNEDHLVIENNRRYFNDAENKENRSDFVIRDFPSLDKQEEDGSVKLTITLASSEKISKEEYQNGISNPKENIQYCKDEVLKESTKWYHKDGVVYKNKENKEEAIFEELIERGETETFYDKKTFKEINVKEAEKIINDNFPKKATRFFITGLDIGVGKILSITIRNSDEIEDYIGEAYLVLKDGQYKICSYDVKELYFPPAVPKKKLPILL